MNLRALRAWVVYCIRVLALRWFGWNMLQPVAGGAAETTTTLDRVLKEFYPEGGIIDQVNVDTYLLDMAEKEDKLLNVQGRYLYQPARFGLSGGSGPRGEGVALPTPGTQTFDDIQIPIRYHYGVVQVTGPVMALSRGPQGAFAEALSLTMDGMYDEFRLIWSIMLYGWGSGVIGRVGSVAGAVITLTDDIHPATWFYEGLKIDSYQSDEVTLRVAGMVVTDVNHTARTVTVTGIGATAATDRLYIAGSRNIAFHGLLASVDDGTYVDTFFNIQRSAAGRARWKSHVSAFNDTPAKYGNTTFRTISGDLIQKALDNQRVKAGAGHPVDRFISSLGVRRSYWNGLSPDRRYNSGAYDGGWQVLKFTNGDVEIMWFADELAPRRTLFGLHTKASPADKGKRLNKADQSMLAHFEALAADWDEATGNQLKQVYSGGDLVDAVGAFLKVYANYGSRRPNAHVRVDDLNEA